MPPKVVKKKKLEEKYVPPPWTSSRPKPELDDHIWPGPVAEELARYVDWHGKHEHCVTPRPLEDVVPQRLQYVVQDEENKDLVYYKSGMDRNQKATGKLPPEFTPTVIGANGNWDEVSVVASMYERQASIVGKYDNDDPWYTMSVKDKLEVYHIDGDTTWQKTKKKRDRYKTLQQQQFEAEQAWAAEQFGNYEGGGPAFVGKKKDIIQALSLSVPNAGEVKKKIGPWEDPYQWSQFTREGTGLDEFRKSDLDLKIAEALRMHEELTKQQELSANAAMKQARKQLKLEAMAAAISAETESGTTVPALSPPSPLPVSSSSSSSSPAAAAANTSSPSKRLMLQLPSPISLFSRLKTEKISPEKQSQQQSAPRLDLSSGLIDEGGVPDDMSAMTDTTFERKIQQEALVDVALELDQREQERELVLEDFNYDDQGGDDSSSMQPQEGKKKKKRRKKKKGGDDGDDVASEDGMRTPQTPGTPSSPKKSSYFKGIRGGGGAGGAIAENGGGEEKENEGNDDDDVDDGTGEFADEYAKMAFKLGGTEKLDKMAEAWIKFSIVVRKQSKRQQNYFDTSLDLVDSCDRGDLVKVVFILGVNSGDPNQKTADDEPIFLHMVKKIIQADSMSNSLNEGDEESPDRIKYGRILSALLKFNGKNKWMTILHMCVSSNSTSEHLH